jgi:hypothetical protein
MIDFIKHHPQQCRIKDEKEKLSLTIFNIRTVHEANDFLEGMTKEKIIAG